jgi:hypothetical protein
MKGIINLGGVPKGDVVIKRVNISAGRFCFGVVTLSLYQIIGFVVFVLYILWGGRFL